MLKRLCSLFIILLAASPVQAQTPQIIAHRGGTTDAPENTLLAIQQALNHHADAIWVTLQLTQDKQIVLYRPSDLSVLTPLKGAVSQFTAQELAQTNSGYYYDAPTFPFRHSPVGIPTLKSVLTQWPDTYFYLDIKSPDADPKEFAHILEQTLQQTHSLNNVRVYSTEARYLDALPATIPHFQKRDITRQILLDVLLQHHCDTGLLQDPQHWHGIEYKRPIQITEKYTLGTGTSQSTWKWNQAVMNCFKSDPKSKVILFGINTKEDYQAAKALGVKGVLMDSPSRFETHFTHKFEEPK